MSQNKVIITVVGKDTVGIIAKICTYLADSKINVLDISQTIVQDFFNMMMIVDIAGCDKAFDTVQNDLVELGKTIGVEVKCQREEIFERMHRL
ncbi:MAG: ACT domain-containing protein [Pseudobutyrivibrio sp.]|nr:ACT domain-containing protein [Pseudobutyrivibrio sp.]